MVAATASGHLFFEASDSGSVLTPSGNFGLITTDFSVFDNGNDASDGNADTATDYYIASSVPYSGYTINIGGNDYAIFEFGNTYYTPSPARAEFDVLTAGFGSIQLCL
jgi:hypothetical protein